MNPGGMHARTDATKKWRPSPRQDGWMVTIAPKMSVPVLPTIAIRLSPSLAPLIKPGLMWCVVSRQRVLAGNSPNALLPPDYWFGQDTGWFDSMFADHLFGTWQKLYPAFFGHRPRLSLDFLDIQFCLIALRALPRLVAHEHCPAPRPDYRSAMKRLHRTLALALRRANKITPKRIGEKLFADLQQRWRWFARCLRFHALSCLCGKPLVPGLRKTRQRILQGMVNATKRELSARGVSFPPDSQLWRWVREAARDVRRYRVKGMGRQELYGQKGGPYLADVVIHNSQQRLESNQITKEQKCSMKIMKM